MSARLPAFSDRADAGRRLGEALADRVEAAVIVYAIPRRGVPVALEGARALEAPLDPALTRKIGAPDNPEVALAALVDGGHPRTVINEDIVRMTGVSPAWLDEARLSAPAELERRRRLYFRNRNRLDPKGHVVVVADDGLATGATARAAIAMALREGVEDFVCLFQPEPFPSVGDACRDFHQVEDAEVIACLAESR